MAAILQLDDHRKSVRPSALLAAGHSATILMFTGVRFERIDFDALKLAHDAQQMTMPTRIAN